MEIEIEKISKILNYFLSCVVRRTEDGIPFIDVADARQIIGSILHANKREIREILKTLEAMGMIRYNNKRVYIYVNVGGNKWNGSICLEL